MHVLHATVLEDICPDGGQRDGRLQVVDRDEHHLERPKTGYFHHGLAAGQAFASVEVRRRTILGEGDVGGVVQHNIFCSHHDDVREGLARETLADMAVTSEPSLWRGVHFK